MEAIQLKQLTKKFKKNMAVDSLNFTIQKGEIFSLLGLNGAGKTTTIKLLTCLLQPTTGDALLLGDSVVRNAQAVKEKIGVSPQETAIAPNLTVQENLGFMARIHGFEHEKVISKTKEMLNTFDLSEVADKRAKTLSGGMQRRLSIAMALIFEPQILFLDEPTQGLDVIARSELWAIIEKLKGSVTILLTTHYMEEAKALSDCIGVLVSGKLKALGTAAELMRITQTNSLEKAFISLTQKEESV